MVDLKIQHQRLAHEINLAIRQVLNETRFILGPNVSMFEEELKVYFKTPYAYSVASGTDALHLALATLNLSSEDEVITTPFSFISTAWAITYCGARPVFVDIDPRTFNIDIQKVEKAITSRTKAIIPVHLFGQSLNIEGLMDIAKRNNLAVVEDCAQAFGAKGKDKHVGTIGDIGCFSFFPSKNLGAYGDGGLIITKNEEIAHKIAMLRNHGSNKRYHHDIVGFNSRLDEIQAAILRVKLRHIDDFNSQRKRVAECYLNNIKNVNLVLPFIAENSDHIFHQFTVLSDKREIIQDELHKNDVSSAIYYPIPIHKQNVYSKEHGETKLPICEDIANRCFSLPIYPELEDKTIIKICNILNSVDLG